MQHPAAPLTTEASAGKPDGEAGMDPAMRAAELGIWDWNLLDGTFLYSPRAREICGLPQDNAPLRLEQLQALTHPDDLSRTHAMVLRAIDPAIRERLPYEYRVVHPDGQVRWVIANG